MPVIYPEPLDEILCNQEWAKRKKEMEASIHFVVSYFDGGYWRMAGNRTCLDDLMGTTTTTSF